MSKNSILGHDPLQEMGIQKLHACRVTSSNFTKFATVYLSASSAVMSSEKHSKLCAADLAHGYALVRHHDRSFVAKFLHLGTLHHLCTSGYAIMVLVSKSKKCLLTKVSLLSDRLFLMSLFIAPSRAYKQNQSET